MRESTARPNISRSDAESRSSGELVVILSPYVNMHAPQHVPQSSDSSGARSLGPSMMTFGTLGSREAAISRNALRAVSRNSISRLNRSDQASLRSTTCLASLIVFPCKARITLIESILSNPFSLKNTSIVSRLAPPPDNRRALSMISRFSWSEIVI